MTVTYPWRAQANAPTVPWFQRPFAVFDVETSGVRRDEDRIVSATVAYNEPGFETVVREWLINPGVELAPEVVEIHGLTNERLREEGQDAAEAIAEITDTLDAMLQPGIPLVIYNAPFDLSMSDREQRRHGVTPLIERKPGLPVICPLTIDKAVNKWVKGKGMRKLTPTAARYGYELKDAHDATNDVLATIAVARSLPFEQPGDDHTVRRNRDMLARMSLEQLQTNQAHWYYVQKTGLADYFTRAGEPEAAASCRAEAPFFPMVPVGQLVD
jgi:DNA polymerase-3 subunit epsilon